MSKNEENAKPPLNGMQQNLTPEQEQSGKRMQTLQIHVARAIKEADEEIQGGGHGEMTVFEVHQVFIQNMLRYNKFGLSIQNKAK